MTSESTCDLRLRDEQLERSDRLGVLGVRVEVGGIVTNHAHGARAVESSASAMRPIARIRADE